MLFRKLIVSQAFGVNLIAVQRVPSLLPSATGVDSAEAQTIVSWVTMLQCWLGTLRHCSSDTVLGIATVRAVEERGELNWSVWKYKIQIRPSWETDRVIHYSDLQ